MLRFGEVELHGPFSLLVELEDKPGIFVVLCHDASRLVPFVVLDIRLAKLVQSEVETALADPKWSEMCSGKLRVAVSYTEDPQEMESIKKEVLRAESPTLTT